MDIIRDVLDKQLIDRDGHELGRVDGILVDQIPGAPPRLTAVLMGASVLTYRLHPRIGVCVAAIERLLRLDGRRPRRVDFTHLRLVGRDLAISLPTARVAADAVDRRGRVWLMKLPGAR